MDTVAGIPAHPLIVHVPVVFIPLTLVAAVAAVAWRGRRRDLSVLTLCFAFVGMIGAQLATMSGESLEERVDRSSLIRQHAGLGESARTLAIVAFLAAAAFAAHAWRDRLPGLDRVRAAMGGRGVAVALSAALLITSGAATLWVVRAGHLGAKASWHDVGAARGEGPDAGR